ncbi:glycosyltransferase family 4 protein [Gluconobacter sphaericus]|uniref:glycosyltransferase family 4 protein n=2 Tax=Gluconobacter sphaericus TaxID=574987 RepID=UPI0038D1D241
MMRICFDTRSTGRSGGTGVATYARMLEKACETEGLEHSRLLDLQRGRPDLNPHSVPRQILRLLKASFSERLVQRNGIHYQVHDLYRTATVRSRTWHKMTYLESPEPPSLMHWTYPLPLMWKNTRNVVTIHDIIPILHPEYGNFSKVEMQRLLLQCCEQADGIVTVSKAVQADLISELGIAEDKITLLPQTVSFSDEELQEARYTSPPCPSNGFLYFGSIEKRKNIERIITAHGLSKTSRPLTLIGNQGFGAKVELAALHTHPRPELVHLIPWCSRSALIRAIQEARAVIYPSLAEGFGLPIIEAMLLGTPVITSFGHATEEIAQQAALLVSPLDVKEISEAIHRIGTNDLLYQSLIQAGLVRAKAFQFPSYARKVGNFYRNFIRN